MVSSRQWWHSKCSGHFCLMWDSSHGQSLLQSSPLGQPRLCQTCITVWGSSCSYTRSEKLTSISLKMCSLDPRNFSRKAEIDTVEHIFLGLFDTFFKIVFSLSKRWMHSCTKQPKSAVQTSRHSHIAQEINKSLEKCKWHFKSGLCTIYLCDLLHVLPP